MQLVCTQLVYTACMGSEQSREEMSADLLVFSTDQVDIPEVP